MFAKQQKSHGLRLLMKMLSGFQATNQHWTGLLFGYKTGCGCLPTRAVTEKWRRPEKEFCM
jgi:hypothetical protein